MKHVEPDEFDISTQLSSLKLGKNVLAIHVMNRTIGSNDLIISPEIVLAERQLGGAAEVYFTVDGSDPRLANGAISPVAQRFSDGVTINATAQVQARGLLAGRWSPVSEVSLVVNPTGLQDLRISELNYNPYESTFAERSVLPNVDPDAFEFIELYNASTQFPVSLLDARFVGGVDLTFGDVALEPGERAVVVANEEAFRIRYGDAPRVIGQWTNQLANGGESLTLVDSGGQQVIDFGYDDSGLWDERADGLGATLELVSPSTTSTLRQGKHYAWRGSSEYGGSPGTAGRGAVGVVINEVLSSSDGNAGQLDAVELWNTTAQAIDVGGWLLSDSSDDFSKYQIAPGTTIAANGYLVLDESNFNPTPQNPGDNDFAFSSSGGDDVWLTIPGTEADTIEAFVDEAHFGAAAVGEAFGRSAVDRMIPMTAPTLGSINSAPRVGPVVLSEIQYNPPTPSQAALAISPELTRGDLEFLEVHNPTLAAVNLTGWRVRGGIDMNFDDNTTLAAGESLVVLSFNPDSPDNAARVAAFRAHYGLPAGARLVGGYGGQLGNGGDRVVLQRATTAAGVRLIEDEAVYDDLSPWAQAADGLGQSLTRIQLQSDGSAASSWAAAAPSPGSLESINADFNNDGVVDVLDIDLVAGAIRANDPLFDLNSDGSTNRDDYTFMVTTLVGTTLGDSNFDGIFNSSDLVLIFQNGEYEDATPANSTWADGDWTADGEFTTSDLVAAFQLGGYQP